MINSHCCTVEADEIAATAVLELSWGNLQEVTLHSQVFVLLVFLSKLVSCTTQESSLAYKDLDS
jgi:hypothetical protein